MSWIIHDRTVILYNAPWRKSRSSLPSFSKSLETALHRALEAPNERSHEYSTLEHLLLALIHDRDAAAAMRACTVDVVALRARVTGYIDLISTVFIFCPSNTLMLQTQKSIKHPLPSKIHLLIL